MAVIVFAYASIKYVLPWRARLYYVRMRRSVALSAAAIFRCGLNGQVLAAVFIDRRSFSPEIHVFLRANNGEHNKERARS